MMSAYPIKSAAVAANYYCQGQEVGTATDYYTKEGEGQWLGKGAQLLGLQGAVDKEQFQAVLEGRLPNGDVLGRVSKDGEIEHRPGTGITFSAPKSVSILALVGGDERILEAERRVIERMVARIEELAATARDKSMEIEGKAHATDNIIAAAFQESANKLGEPQLHSHVIIANATRNSDGEWRSMQERAIYSLQKSLGEEYRMELAAELQALGYQIQETRLSDGSFGFEVAGVPQEVLEYFSQRTAQVEAALQAQGLTRQTATAEQIQAAVNATRREAADGAEHAGPEQRAAWREEAAALGYDARGMVLEAQASAPEGASVGQARQEAARAAVGLAIAHLSERETRFGREELLTAAKKFAASAVDANGNKLEGRATVQDLRQAIKEAREQGDLIQRAAREYDPRTHRKVDVRGYTTAEGVRVEERMLASVARMSAAGEAIATKEEAKEAIRRQETATGYPFNPGQRAAAEGILTDASRMHLVQGYAGTAKTTSVLAAVAAQAREGGIEVVALAPTGSAAQTLGREIGAEGSTVASWQNALARGDAKEAKVWIVDEFGLLGTRDAQKLIQAAEKQGATLVAVGDWQQLGSVPAGAAFRQVVESGQARVHVLEEIVRQKDEQLREAVYHSIKCNAAAMLEKIEQSKGGAVIEINAGEDKTIDAQRERYERIADIYCMQTPEKQAETVIVEPSKDGRTAINEAVRERLQAQGAIQGPAVAVQTLEAKDLTETQAKVADSYKVGDVLIAHRTYNALGMEAGEAARVTAVDLERNRITVENAEGWRTEINPGRYSKLSAYGMREIEVAAGDKLVMRGSEGLSLKNGMSLTVEKVEGKAIHVRDAHGGQHELDGKKLLQVDHGYALTGPQAQGLSRTHAIMHAESHRINLVTQQLVYVGASRAVKELTVVTDSRQALVEQIRRESGQKMTAMVQQQPPKPPAPENKPPAPKPPGPQLVL